MAEDNMQRTREDLYNFLDFAAQKGLIKWGTARTHKVACKTILGILDDSEAADLSKIDLEAVIIRHKNLAASKIKPETLKKYESYVRLAVRGFIEYAKDPSAWKPSVTERTRRTKEPPEPPKKPESVESEKQPEMRSQPSVHIDLQIHIPPEASPTQIDQIFASISRHLYGK